jgi:hypothetical protein
MATNYVDIAQQNADTTRASAAAQATYNASRAQNDNEATALAKAQFAWQKTMQESSLTGQYQGRWTQPALTNFANLFGTWQAPTAGQQTLGAQNQYFQQGQDLSSLYGQYYAPGTAPTQGQATLTAQQQAANIAAQQAGLYGQILGANGQLSGPQTLAGQQQQFSQAFQQQQFAAQQQQLQQQNAQSYLQLLSSLRGPADWAKYQQVLGATPGGMRDLVAAAAGQYIPGGGATTGLQPQAANLNTLVGQVAGQGPYGSQPMPYQAQQYQQPQWQGGQYGALQRGVVPTGQAPVQQMQAQGGDFANGVPVDPSTVQWSNAQYGAPQRPQQAWGSGIGVGQQQATPQQQQQGLGNGTNLPAPNQISAQSWGNMAPSQQQMLLGMYENQGWDKGDVQALMNQSLPKYGTNNASAGTWRLQG